MAEPFRSEADLARLRPFEPGADAPYVAETVRLVRRELAGSGVALIGFAGAPFTLASYASGGRPVAHLRPGQGTDARRPRALAPS